MAYISTRGHGAPVDLQDLLVRGTAEDGGLYVPEDWPTLSSSALSAPARKSYSEIASGLLELFGGENWKTGGFSEGIRQSLDNFAVPEGPPLVKLDEKLWALELFHGPTFAFKDYALVPLAQTIEHKLHLEDGQATVLCATSGDTGAATAAAFAGRPRLRAVLRAALKSPAQEGLDTRRLRRVGSSYRQSRRMRERDRFASFLAHVPRRGFANNSLNCIRCPHGCLSAIKKHINQ